MSFGNSNFGFSGGGSGGGGGTVSGTLNYIAKFTPNGTSVGNGLMFDDGTGVGLGTITPSAKFDIIGAGTTSATYGLKVGDGAIVSALNFYVRDDGAVSSKLGYWIDGVKKVFVDATLNTAFWHQSSSVATFGTSNRNVVVGNSDSTAPTFTSGNSNSIFGSFSSVGISSGGYNIVIGNYTVTTPTTGSGNIIFGRGGMSDPAVSDTISFNGMTSAANQVVFGHETYSRYKDWWFGHGKNVNIDYGVFSMNWYATSSLAGQNNSAGMVTNWIFNGSQGTGTGVGGGFIWNVAPAGSTGSSINSFIEALRILQSGYVGVGIAAPTSTLHNGGSTGLINNVSAAGTLTLGAKTIYVFSGTTTTWSLPAISGTTDRTYFIKNRGSGAITLDVTGGATVIYTTSAVASFTINAGEAYIISNDGTYWNIQ